jgi:hypothetical protein
VVTGGGVAASGGDQVAGEGGQGPGRHDGDGPEAELDRVVACVDVVDDESADRRGSLGVEQDQQSGDAVVGVEGVVVQQLFGLVPAPGPVGGPGRSIGWRRTAGGG